MVMYRQQKYDVLNNKKSRFCDTVWLRSTLKQALTLKFCFFRLTEGLLRAEIRKCLLHLCMCIFGDCQNSANWLQLPDTIGAPTPESSPELSLPDPNSFAIGNVEPSASLDSSVNDVPSSLSSSTATQSRSSTGLLSLSRSKLPPSFVFGSERMNVWWLLLFFFT